MQVLCPTGRRLDSMVPAAIRELEQADANMRNTKLAFAIRDQSWKDAVKLVSEARKRSVDHTSTCDECNGKA